MQPPERKLFKILRFIALMPLFLALALPLLLVFGPFALYAYISLIADAISTKRKMKKQGRITSRRTLERDFLLTKNYGTFILDSYTLGWGVCRLWWTPDAIPKNDEFTQLETEDSDPLEKAITPYYCRIHETYTHLDKGTALLWKTWASRNVPLKEQRLFPDTPVIQLWSGGIEMKRQMDAREKSDKPV